ncbi:MAG: Fic family protein [Candidatus Peribacteria bacterium]|nr:Fic family protein [Candidatus Peribacteria bacterium]
MFEEKVSYIPPKEKFLKEELKRFIDFANDKLNSDVFIHPIIKAIIIHFWIGYLHPFCD